MHHLPLLLWENPFNFWKAPWLTVKGGQTQGTSRWGRTFLMLGLLPSLEANSSCVFKPLAIWAEGQTLLSIVFQ